MNKFRLARALTVLALLVAAVLAAPSANAATTSNLAIRHTVVGRGQVIFVNRNPYRVDLSVGKLGAAKWDQDTSIPAYGFRVVYTHRYRFYWEAYATHLNPDGSLTYYGHGHLRHLQRAVAPGVDQCWNIRRRQPYVPRGMVQTDAGCIARR